VLIGGVDMFNNDMEYMLTGSKVDLFTAMTSVSEYMVVDAICADLDRFMKCANNRNIVLGRSIPIGFEMSIHEYANSQGSGFFNTRNYISISIPYVHVDYETEKVKNEVYKDYLYSVFGYKIFSGDSCFDVQNELKEAFKNFSNTSNGNSNYIYRPIGLSIQPIASHKPMPALNGFSSKYRYVGVLLYEEIFIDKLTFLIYTHQVKDYGTKENQLWKWDDGRVIGEKLDEGLKNFPEDEGLVFYDQTFIMYEGPFLRKYK